MMSRFLSEEDSDTERNNCEYDFDPAEASPRAPVPSAPMVGGGGGGGSKRDKMSGGRRYANGRQAGSQPRHREARGQHGQQAGGNGKILCRICGDSAVRHVHYGGRHSSVCRFHFSAELGRGELEEQF